MSRLTKPAHLLLMGVFSCITACGGGGTEPTPEPPQVELGQFPSDLAGRLAFVAVAVGAGPSLDYTSWLHVIDARPHSDRVVYLAVREEFKNSVAWTPHGTALFVDGAYTANPDAPGCPVGINAPPCIARETHRIDPLGGGEVLRMDRFAAPAVAPDGRLALVNDVTGEIEVDGVVVPRLFPGDLRDQRLAWAPSGRQMAVTGALDQTPGITLLDIASGTGTRILNGAPDEVISDPAYAPDGTRIAFRWGGGQRSGGEIWTIGPDGSGLAAITTGFEDAHPAWTTDGRYLSFVRREYIPPFGTTQYTIYLVAAGGVPLAVAWSKRVILGAHAWSP